MKLLLKTLLALVLAAFALNAATPVDAKFFWLDWTAPPGPVTHYTLYLGPTTNPMSKIKLGNQTSIRVIRNKTIMYAAVTASNAGGESPRSNEVYIISP